MRIRSKPAFLTKNVALAALFVMILTPLSCRHAEAPLPNSFTASFRVALLTPGPVSDAGWNAAAFDGLQLIKRQLGAAVATVQTASPARFHDALSEFFWRQFALLFARAIHCT